MATETRLHGRLHTHRLGNGLQLLGQHMPDVQSAALVFHVNTGVRDEPAAHMGVSHFLEHMAFRCGPHMTGQELERAFEDMGADHNAATGMDRTFYWMRVLSQHLDEALEVLSELPRPSLEGDDFDRERPIILEEIARYRDLPGAVLRTNFLEDFFGVGHPLSRQILGTEETIGSLTVDDMRAYQRARYGVDNMVFALAGQFEWSRVVDRLEELTRDWTTSGATRPPAPIEFHAHTHAVPVEKFGQQHIAIGVPSVTRSDPRYYASAVLATILGDDTGSRLFWALNQTGLAETAVAHLEEFDEVGLLMVRLTTEPTRAQKALDVARQEMARLQAFDVTEEELARARVKLSTSVVIGGESANERVMRMIRSWIRLGKVESLEELREQIERVTLGDLRSLLEAFPINPEQVVTAVGPVSALTVV